MSLVDRAFSEKRDFIRMKIDTPIRAQLTGEGLAAEGVCHELSGGGMRVETQHEITPGTEIEVSIASEHGHSPSLHARARVVRAHAEQGSYFLGLEILELLS